MSKTVKRMVCFGLVVLFTTFTTLAVYAGGSGNCVKPLKDTTEKFALGGGYEFNYSDSRLFKLDNWFSDYPDDFKLSKVWQSYGRFMYGIADSMNLYANIGATGYDLEYKDNDPNADVTLDIDTGLLTGLGVDGWYPIEEWRIDCGRFGHIDFGWEWDAMINFFFNDVSGVTRGNQTGNNVTGTVWGLDGLESIHLSAQYEIELIKTKLIPYIGAYHSWIFMDTMSNINYSTATLLNKDTSFGMAADLLGFGLVFGLDIDVAKYVNVNIEGRVIGETAITTGVTLKI